MGLRSLIQDIHLDGLNTQLSVVIRGSKQTSSHPIVHLIERTLEIITSFWTHDNRIVFESSDANDLVVDEMDMNWMAMGGADEHPIFSSTYLRIICFATHHVVIVSVEEMHSAFLEDGLHSHLADALCWVADGFEGAESIDLGQIIED